MTPCTLSVLQCIKHRRNRLGFEKLKYRGNNNSIPPQRIVRTRTSRKNQEQKGVTTKTKTPRRKNLKRNK